MQPLVSICMITYNHEKYIAQAIESVLMQETDFDFELVIGEDCSTDRTREIVTRYKEKYPDRIQVLFPPENSGVQENLAATIQACRGTYLAFLEGDDYWTSEKKLQRQVDFLEGHPACSLCFHKVTVFFDDDSDDRKSYSLPYPLPHELSTIHDIIDENFLPTCSVMYVRGALPDIPEWTKKYWMMDWPLHLLVATQGDIGFIDLPMAAYRRHSGGACAGTDQISKYHGIIDMLEMFDRQTAFQYDRTVQRSLLKKEYSLSLLYMRNDQFQVSKKLLLNIITRGSTLNILLKIRLALLLISRFCIFTITGKKDQKC